MSKFILIFSLSLFAITAEAGILECWPRNATEPLTLSRIMRQFRDNLNDAEPAISRGMMTPADVTDAELESSVAFVRVAVACADVVLENSSESLLPSRSRELTGEAREAFLQKYFGYMTEFRAGLLKLVDLIQELRAKPATERDFRPAYSQEAAVREIANQAHHHL